MSNILDQVLTAAEADELYGMGKGTTRKYCHLDRFKTKRQSGSTWLVTKEECDLLYGKISGNHENVNERNWPIEVPANENHEIGNHEIENHGNENDGNVNSVIAGFRRTVHVLRADGKPLCGARSVLDEGSIKKRPFAEINCTHCVKWYKPE